MSTVPSATRSQRAATPARRRVALAALVLAVVLLAVDGTVLALAVPALTEALDPSAVQVLWIGDIYSFVLAGLLVVMGGVADKWGRKRLLLVGSIGFGVASVAAGLAPTAEWLIAARVLQGVAGATLMPSTLSIIRDLYPDARERTTAVAVWAAAAWGGAAAGPLVGGALLEHFWWGSVFVINAPIVVVLVVGVAVFVPESRDPSPGRFDLPSAALSLLAVVPVVYAVKELAVHGAGLGAGVALAVGVACGVVFVRRQIRLAATEGGPMIDVTLFRVPAFGGSVTATLISVFAFSGLLFFFSQYLQLVRGFGPLEAGIRELPMTVAAIALIPLAGPLTRRFGYGRVIGSGLVVAGIGMALLALAEGAESYAPLAGALVLVGLGSGLSLTLGTDAVLSTVSRDKAGAAAAVSETAYELGVATGIAVLGSALTAVYRLRLPAGPAYASESPAAALQGPAEVAGPATEAFVEAMQVVSLLAAAMLLIAGLVAWLVIDRPGPAHRTDDESEPLAHTGAARA